VKYAPDDSPIEIWARAEPDAILLGVTDHGIGIPAADAGLIGRRFFRASNTKPATGTGLGLYNARQLLDYHNGTLTLQPGPDGGTIATVRLPQPGLAPRPALEEPA
jgi:signal transduction histidine kinase